MWVTHLFFLPAMLGAIWQAMRLASQTIGYQPRPFWQLAIGMALLLADPTFLTQLLLPGTDVWLLFFRSLVIQWHSRTKLKIHVCGLAITLYGQSPGHDSSGLF
jgi:hypothetical protein